MIYKSPYKWTVFFNLSKLLIPFDIMWLAKSFFFFVFELLLENAGTEVAPLFASWKCSGCPYASILGWPRSQPTQTGFLLDGTKPEELQRNSYSSLSGWHSGTNRAFTSRTTLTLDYRKSPQVLQKWTLKCTSCFTQICPCWAALLKETWPQCAKTFC